MVSRKTVCTAFYKTKPATCGSAPKMDSTVLMETISECTKSETVIQVRWAIILCEALPEKDSSHLYIGTDDGLFIMDKLREKFHPIDQKSTNGEVLRSAINALHIDQNGALWIGTMGQGVFRYNPSENTLRPVRIRGLDLGKNATWSLLEDRAGTLWAGTRLGLLRYNKERGGIGTR